MKRAANPFKSFVLMATGIFISLLLQSVPVSAHTSQTDGTISAELHVEPNDKPHSETETSLHFEFSDKANLFSLPSCKCQLKVQQNTTNIATMPLGGDDSLVSENTFVFPTPGEYTVQVSGQPKDTATFQPFKLNYHLTVQAKEVPAAVNTQAKNAQAAPILLWVSLGLIWLVIALVIFTIIRRRV